MPASPDTDVFVAFLQRARRRALGLGALRGAAAGFVLAAIIVVAGATTGSLALGGGSLTLGGGPLAQGEESLTLGAIITLALVAAGAAIGAATAATRRLAPLIERRTPASRNLIFTAAELLEHPDTTKPHVAARVVHDASALTATIDLRRVLPSRAAAIAIASAIVIWSAAAVLASRTSRDARAGASSDAAATIIAIDVEITPPDYTEQPAHTLHDPARIDALAGSRIRLMVTADAGTVAVDTITASQPLAIDGRSFTTTVIADADGYLAIAPTAVNGSPGARRLIGLSVTPDQAPRVRITAPGHDVMVRDGTFVLPFAIEADDDLGLASLRLLYTRIAGSGENFTFTEGEVPVTVTRPNGRAWGANGSWAIGPLHLEPGDMLIYRGVATDRRPGAPPAESDRFIVEIAAPGAMPSDGFAIDDRFDKYAISQQMVILNTERLLAKRASMPADDVRREAEGIAAEQRQVRAEFIFMLGGELADLGVDLTSLNEEVEAAGETDLAAGRLANQGRADLLRAIRSMSLAAARLVEANLTAALPTEREALVFLQRAFSRSRYILRTLGERERLDLSRRLTGVLAALARSDRPAAEPPPSPRILAVRRALADLAVLAADSGNGATDTTARATMLAERVLRIDPASSPLKDAAAAITNAAWDRAATSLAAIVRAELPVDPRQAPNAQLDALAGALADALRRQGRQP